MVLHVVRITYLLVVLGMTVTLAFHHTVIKRGPTYATLYIIAPALVAFAVIMVDMFWRKKRLKVLSGMFFGLLAGLVIAYGLVQIVNLAERVFVAPPEAVEATNSAEQPSAPRPPAESPSSRPVPHTKRPNAEQEMYADTETHPVLSLIKVLLGASAVFMCVSFVLQTKDDFRFMIPYVEFTREMKGARPLLLDTSVIIDGRIADVADTRILESQVIVPRFILAELQAIADSDDKLKRNRGRRGLDILNRLQTTEKVDIQILDAHAPRVDSAVDVDAKLVALAEHLDGRIITNDYNLNKVAQLRGVVVINLNDLANALKPIVLPGESINVKVIKPGEEPGQGVGYLEDGTMVVAEQGREHVGRDVTIIVTSILQTSAGRMIFGRLDADRTFGHGHRRT